MDNFEGLKMSDITISQAAVLFLESIESTRADNTLQTYRKALGSLSDLLITNQIDPFNFPVVELPETYVISFVDYVKKFSPATENLYLQVINSFFKFLDAENPTTVKPSRVRMIIRQRTHRFKSDYEQYPEEQIKKMIEYISDLQHSSISSIFEIDSEDLRIMRDRALILTIADTGLRVHEVCILKCGEIDWERSRVMLKGRGNKQAVVRFSTRAINAIRDYLSLRESLDLKTGHRQSTLPLFARHDKGAGKKIKPITPTTVRNVVTERVCQILGPEMVNKITPHTFLHYFVTTILRQTGNLKLAQVLARHSNIQVTQRYAHIDDDELDRGYYEIFERKTK